jgi:hypothetical protein
MTGRALEHYPIAFTCRMITPLAVRLRVEFEQRTNG